MKQRNKSLTLAIIALFVLALGAYGLAQGGGSSQGKGVKNGVNHKARQTRPIQLGTSGGNAKDLANGYCCSGTLGALVQIGGAQYILSNTHVFAGDMVSGGNNRVSTAGDGINQPGLVDVACADIPADYVANLSQWAPLNSNANVDAAIAQVISGAVSTDGAILEIGTIGSTPVGAFPGQAVKKSGRTTGLTRSTVDSVGATVSVQYTDECAGNTFIKTFTGQILVKNRGNRFLNGGDSGSLMVEDVASNPGPVGLLYAGSSVVGVANTIGDVLTYFGALIGQPATMVGAGTTTATTISTAQARLQQDLARAMRTKELKAKELAGVPGSVGHAVGLGDSGVVIKVLVEEITKEALASVPQQLDGFPIVVEAVGRIVAF
ncbi:MAG: hypothetical protein HY644_07380 [Acidobacteria bacterium]|nr:hypothetical protein [Acidobacteriota bacterium]